MTLVTAVVVLILFSVFVVFLVVQADVSELRWSRLVWLFASVEAIAFGAAGALFGSSIQRSRAENAEEEARKKHEEAARGRALAAALKADDPGQAPTGRLESLGPTGARDPAGSLAARHAALARELFPDESGRG